MYSHEPDVCWICLESGTNDNPLALLCKCPRPVHQQCLARWQLQSVGRKEERTCRFCQAELPEWTSAFPLPVATPAMMVSHNGVQHTLFVKPGAQGKLEFQQRVRDIFGLNANDTLDLTFGCKAPGTDQDVALKGWYSYDAAVQCAAFSAGAKIASQQARYEALLAASTPAMNACSHETTSQSTDQMTAPPSGNMPRHVQSSRPANQVQVIPAMMHIAEHHTAYQAAHQAPAVTMQAARHAAMTQAAARAAHTQGGYVPQHSAEAQAAGGTCTPYILHTPAYAASSQASDSAASSASAFAAQVPDRHRPVMTQPWPASAANNAMATQREAGLDARTISTESTAASSTHAGSRRGHVVQRGDLVRRTASMVPSLLTSLQNHPKRPRCIADVSSTRIWHDGSYEFCEI